MSMKIHTVLVLASTSIIWLWVCLTTTLPKVDCQPSCQESEKAVLVEFSNYSGFDLRGMWGSDIENRTKCVCEWFGVECDRHGFIVKLSLRYDLVEMGGSSVLNTSLATVSWPVSLAKLHFLKELELLGFYHNSPLPHEIGLLSQSLTSLSLPQCKILPPLPLAALTNLSNLAHLDLSSQGVDTEPLDDSIPKLFLGSPIPQQLCNITTLEYLDLTGNGFAVIPSCVGLLPHLSHLDLLDNNLEGPSVLQHIFWARGSNLTYLDLSSNFLSGHIYPEISSNAVKMSFLKLEGNNLTGNIPESLGELSEITLLGLGFNHLTGSIPASFGNLKKLGSLDLSNNMLSGEIPHQLGNLTKLGSLDLSNNMLSGEIPHQLGNLANIATDSPRYESDNIESYMPNSNPLDLSFNQLSGKIPASLGGIGANASLLQVAIDLSHNNLTGDLPWQLLTGSAIDVLHLQSNFLTGFAAFDISSPGAVLAGAVVNKSFLEMLDVSYNKLTGPIPAWIISHLSDLSFLDFSHNHLEEAATFSYRSSAFSLTDLYLGSNNLKGIPTWLSNQSSLNSLDLSFNQLEGTIPAWLWSLKINNILDLSMNKLRGDISLDGVCCYSFNASHNHFSRLQAPSNSCSDRFGLRVLDLQSNHLSGLLPWHAGLSNFSNSGLFWAPLESLNLADNNFFGDLPEFSSSQSGFSVYFDSSRPLDLSHNQLSGGIPTSIGSWQLTSVRLSSNNFSGEVPISSLCNGTSLAVLKLDSNSLSGSIADEIGLCSGVLEESGHFSGGLSSLVLKDNLLEGFLPPALANLSRSLQVLDLSHNSFQGGIPPWIQHMESLRVLVLSHNGFSGHLPPTTWNTTQLQVLDLSSNKLTGTIPSTSLSRLLQGFLYNSVLKSISNGTLYDELISVQAKDQVLVFTYLLSATISLDLSNNALSGPIPVELGLLDGLVFLSLSHNHLSGPIPESLGQLRQLNSLDLSNNELVGDIPTQALCLLTFLGSLDVSHNKLSGPIPQCNQWGTFTGRSFLGNKGLCGRQIEQPCSAGPAGSQGDGDRAPLMNDEDDHSFLLAIFVGFCIGFPTLLVLSIEWDLIRYHIIRASRWVLS